MIVRSAWFAPAPFLPLNTGMFFGRRTVEADLRLHKMQAGLVTTGTLNLMNGGTVAYANVCKWPVLEVSGLGQETAAHQETMITAWRLGESQAPRADDIWAVGGKLYGIVTANTRHNHDESSGYAIYDCTCTRKG